MPKSFGGVTIHSLTGKLTCLPFKPVKWKQTELNVFSVVLPVNYAFGKQYFGFSPEKYPFEYCGFPMSLHAGAFVGGQVNKKLRNIPIDKIGLYYEVVTYDVLLVSYLAH